MKERTSLRKPAVLSESTQRKLGMYAVSATAAGVGLLALAQPADAKIIYVPTHKHISLGHGVSLALNREGVVNFKILVMHFSFSSSGNGLGVVSAKGNFVAGYDGPLYLGPQASAFPAGVKIGNQLQFVSRADSYYFRVNMVSATTHSKCRGPWADVSKRYLGLKFRVKNGPTQYGWARLNVTCGVMGNVSGLLTGYAYETIPNKGIITGKTKGPNVVTMTPQTGTLGHLALGRK